MSDSDDLSRLLGEIGRVGQVAADRVVDQFAHLARLARPDTEAEAEAGDTSGPPDLDDADTDLGRALRAARAEVERALDGAAAAVSRSLDAVAEVVDAAVRRDGRVADEDQLHVVLDATGHGTGTFWVHNTTAASCGPLRLVTSELRSPDGTPLMGAVTLQPLGPHVVPAASSVELTLEVRAGAGTQPGRYHGLVLGGPDPEVALHVVVEVPRAGDPPRPATDAGDPQR